MEQQKLKVNPVIIVIAVAEIILGAVLFIFVNKSVGIILSIMGIFGFIITIFLSKNKQSANSSGSGNEKINPEMRKKRNSRALGYVIPLVILVAVAFFMGPMLMKMYTYNQIIDKAVPALGKITYSEPTGNRINREPEFYIKMQVFCFDSDAPDSIEIEEIFPGNVPKYGDIFKLVLNPEDMREGFIISAKDEAKYHKVFEDIDKKFSLELK